MTHTGDGTWSGIGRSLAVRVCVCVGIFEEVLFSSRGLQSMPGIERCELSPNQLIIHLPL
jgi:hypothetical protein